MQVKYDKVADAKYVTVKRGKVSATKPINEWLNFDLNKKGDVIGIEILDASKNEVVIHGDGKNVTSITFLDEELPELPPMFASRKSIEELAHAS